MSDATRLAVEEAITTHLRDSGEQLIVTSWIVVASATSVENDAVGITDYWRIGPDPQPFHVTIGLLETGKHLALGDDDDDDD